MLAFGHTHKAETLYVRVIHGDVCLTRTRGTQVATKKPPVQNISHQADYIIPWTAVQPRSFTLQQPQIYQIPQHLLSWVFRSFYAGGTLLRTLQFSEGGKSRKNKKHDRTMQISIYLHLMLVFSAAIPLTLPVAFSLSLCDHTHFFFFCLAVKDLVTLMVYPFLSLLCPCPCYFGFMPWKASPRH